MPTDCDSQQDQYGRTDQAKEPRRQAPADTETQGKQQQLSHETFDPKMRWGESENASAAAATFRSALAYTKSIITGHYRGFGVF